MLEKFTEKALNAVIEAQNQAKIMQNVSVQPEHLLLAVAKQAKGMSLKIFKMYDITFEDLLRAVDEKLRFEKSSRIVNTPPFSDATKDVLKRVLDLAQKSGNSSILYEHLFLALLSDKNSYIQRILNKFDFDIYKSKDLLSRLVQKKTKRQSHPESEENKLENPTYLQAESFFEGNEASEVFEQAVSKLSASNYEILGTEQIILSILENKESELAIILEKAGITAELFEQKLKEQKSRQAEFEGKQVIFTPNAFIAMNLALETAKEYGFSEVTPTHMVLGLLKSKKGIAYNILKDLHISDTELEATLIKPIEKQMPETLTIMRLAKQEARRLGRNTVGTEMFLLGIIGESTGIGARVLNELEINIKDARQVVEGLIGYGNEYFDNEITFTERAKKVLETAWELAKRHHHAKIESNHLLYAITTVQDCLAVKTLGQLGVDSVEIRQGIIKETEKSDYKS